VGGRSDEALAGGEGRGGGPPGEALGRRESGQLPLPFFGGLGFFLLR